MDHRSDLKGQGRAGTAQDRGALKVSWESRAFLFAMIGVVAPSVFAEGLTQPSELPTPPRGVPLAALEVSVEVIGESRWLSETHGMVLSTMEQFLGEWPGLVTVFDGQWPQTAMGLSVRPQQSWTLTVSVEAGEAATAVTGELCDPKGRCRPLAAQSSSSPTGVVVAETLATLVQDFGRELTETQAELMRPESRDPYALLVLGRAAAIQQGLMGEVEEGPPLEDIWGTPDAAPHRLAKRSEVERAAFLDPTMGSAWWTLAKHRTSLEARQQALQRGLEVRGKSVMLWSEKARLHEVAGELRAADAAWDTLQDLSPDDPRFLLPRAVSLKRRGRADQGRALVQEAYHLNPMDPKVLRVQIEWSEEDEEEDLKALADWSALRPADPEPYRRRLSLHLERRELSEALRAAEMLSELSNSSGETLGLRMALAAELGHGDTLRRLAMEKEDRAVLERLNTTTEEGELWWTRTLPEQLILARGLLASGRVSSAERVAKGILSRRPNWPEALDVWIAICERRGSGERCEKASKKLRWADPFYGQEIP